MNSAALPSFDDLYSFIRGEYLHSRFEGMNASWPNGVPEGGTYAELIVRGYMDDLTATGAALIAPTESRRAKLVRFDRSLTITNPDAPPEEFRYRAGSLSNPMGGDWS